MIIIDGMALVNTIPKTERIKICDDFAQVFIDQLSNMAGDSDEVRLVFDIYINTSQRKNGQRGHLHLPCQGHYLNPEYFSEESPLEYQDKSRTNNIIYYLAAKTTLTNMQMLSLISRHCYFPYDGSNVSEPTM